MAKIGPIRDMDVSSIESLSLEDSNTIKHSEDISDNKQNNFKDLTNEHTSRSSVTCTNSDDSHTIEDDKEDIQETQEQFEETHQSKVVNHIFTITGELNRSEINENELAPSSLDIERISHERKANDRQEAFRSIILNEPTVFSWKQLSYNTFFTIMVSIIATTPFSLIPASDLVQEPDKWYEILFHGAVLIVVSNLGRAFEAGTCLNIQLLQTTRNLSYFSLVGIFVMVLLLVTSYWIWTQTLFYQYPIPRLGTILHFVFYIPYIIFFWIIFPVDWRKNNTFRKRFFFYSCYCLYLIVMVILYDVITVIIKKTPDQYQPIAALLLSLLREASEMILIQVVTKSASGDARGAIIFMKYTIATRHTLIFCKIIGNSATKSTSFVLMAVDFFLNIYLCLRIIWLKKQQPNMMIKQIEKLQDLALYEMVEFQTPLAFIIVLCITYFGPNGALYGNVLNSYWTFKPVEDIYQTVTNMVIFFLVDFSSTVVSAILLFHFCEIRLWEVFLKLQAEFGRSFNIMLSYLLVLVRK